MGTSRIAKLLFMLSADNKALLDQMKQTKSKMTTFQKQVSKIGVALGGIFATRQIIQFGREATELAGRMQGVEAAFNRIDTPGLLDNLKTATRETASELTLMQQAVKAKNFRIPMDVFTKGLEFATKRAAETGESIDYMLNSFTTAMGRESVKILDNLGISALELNEELKKTGDFTTAASNIMDRELGKMGETLTTDAQKTMQLTAAMEDLSIAIGGTLNPAVGALKTLFIDIARDSASFFEAFNKLKDEDSLSFWEKLVGIIAPFNKTMRSAITVASQYIETEDELMDRLAEEAKAAAKAILERRALAAESKRAIPIYEELNEKLKALSEEKMTLTLADKDRIAAINDETQAINRQIKALDESSLIRTKFANISPSKRQSFQLFDTAEIDAQMADVTASLQRGYDLQAEMIRGRMLDIGQMIGNGISSMVVTISEGLGELATGDIGMEQFFSKVIQSFATFLKQMGAMLIAYGVAKTVMETSGNPYAMIIAGAAMVAIGAAMGALMKNQGSAFSGGGGGGSGGGAAYQTVGYTAPKMELQGVIKGEDIHIVTQKYNSRTTRTGG